MPLSLLGLGGGMIVNGLMNALVSSVNSRKSIEANQEFQHINLKFQEAQQKKQWKHAEKLQRDMRELTRRNFVEQIEHQRHMADLQALEQHWPLLGSSPIHIIDEFNECLSAGENIPLQLIIVENGDLKSSSLSISSQVRNAINELNKFMSRHYGLCSKCPVKIHDNTKPGARFGSAEVNTLYKVFKVAPTMVLSSRVHNEEYIVECWFWGGGMATKPYMVEIYRCNVKELQLAILQQFCSEWEETKLRLGVSDPDNDALLDLMTQIQKKQDELRSRGASDAEIREYSIKPFASELAEFTSKTSKKINAAPFIQKINEGIERTILSSFKLSASLLSDVYFLLEHKESPRYMRICSDELRVIPRLQQQAESFFQEAIGALPEGEKAMMHVRMAVAYKEADMPQKALSYGVQCAQELSQMVSPEYFALEASDEMLSALQSVKMIEGVEARAPWISKLSTHASTPAELNQRAVTCYHEGRVEDAISLWNKGANQGHLKCIVNVAQVLESQNRMEEAFEWNVQAIQMQYEPFYSKGHDLALQYCQKGEWANAFNMWCIYLRSGDSRHRAAASAYSAFLLFTSTVREIFEVDCERWAKTLGCYDATLSIQEQAQQFLLSAVNPYVTPCAELIPFYDVLEVWFAKSCGMSVPFIYGLKTDVELIFVLPQNLPSEYKDIFEYCLYHTQRSDIKEYINDIIGI